MSITPNANVHELDMLSAIESRATTAACWEALIFLGQNPSAQTHAEVIAQKCGESTRQTVQDLNELINLGILKEYKNGKQKSYGLVDDPSIRESVVRFARRATFD